MTTSLYLRYIPGTDRRTPPARYPLLDYGSGLIGQNCAECGKPILGHQRPTLFAVGPDSIAAAERDAAGIPYNALAVAMHESCAYQMIKVTNDS